MFQILTKIINNVYQQDDEKEDVSNDGEEKKYNLEIKKKKNKYLNENNELKEFLIE